MAADDPEQTAPDRRPWTGRLRSLSDAYGLVLFLSLLLIILPGFVPSSTFWTVAFAACGAAAILTALQSSRVPLWLLWASAAILLVSIVALVGRTDGRTSWYEIGALFAIGGLMTLTAVAILSRIFRHSKVTPRTLFGALSVYLLIGLAFSYVFQAVDAIDEAAIDSIQIEDGSALYVYFSFVTMTTLGYGDVTPTNEAARTLAVFETLTGQVFLVVVVARLVTLLGRDRDIEDRMRHQVLDRLHRDE